MATFNLANLFRNTQQVSTVNQPGPNAAPTPGAPAPGAANATPVPPGSTMQQPDPGVATPKNPDGTPQNPSLDPFAKIWETDPKATPPVDPWSTPILPSTPDAIQKAAKSMNMMQGVDPALVQKVQAGGDTAALIELMNAVAQNTLAMSTQLSAASGEHVARGVRDRLRTELPGHMRDFQLDNLPTENPVLNHPAAQGLLKMVRKHIKDTNPGMSAAQVNAQATTYLSGFGEAVQAGNSNTQLPGMKKVELDETGTPVQDWSSFEQ